MNFLTPQLLFVLLSSIAHSISATHHHHHHPIPPFSCSSKDPSTPSYTFCRQDLPITDRAYDLVSRLTLDEKISQLSHKASAIPRLGIPYYNWWSEALHGVAKVHGQESGVSFNGTIRHATSFPQVILTAATFDSGLWYKIGRVTGKEARAIYNEGEAIGVTFWTPNINIFRDPRWGRGQETPGEDPLVTSQYAVSYVRGIQGDSYEGGAINDGSLLVSACCKHFTAYDLEDWNGLNRFTFNARVTKQDMADTFQPPFRGCVEQGRSSGMMCSYNLVNGVPACTDYNLLTRTARGKWGFQGYIVSDCDAVSHIYWNQSYAKSHEEAVADVLKAGMDINCGKYMRNHTKSAVEKGKVSVSDIDRALHNLFAIRMRLGLFNGDPREHPYGKLNRHHICSPKHKALALEAARHGIVLLRNSENILPLSKSKTKSLAVIGPNANDSETVVGNYAGPPCKPITPLEGLQSYVKTTHFHPGCNTINCTSVATSKAVELAKSADFVVLVMGINQDLEREELDRSSLVLPGKQKHLITSVAEAAKNPVILVLLCGGPVDVSFAKKHPKIGSILWAGYPGEAGGRAIAEIIFGDHNPGGKLPLTWYPEDYVRVPMSDMRMRPDPSTDYPGRTYRFYRGEKVFEFGYGLSYTNYSYKIIFVSKPNLKFKKTSNTKDSSFISVSEIGSTSCERAKLSVVVEVKNEGTMAGKHPVLLFLKRDHDHGSKGSPVKQLIGFQTVSLNGGEKRKIEFWVNPCEHLSRANEDGEMVIDSGEPFLVAGDCVHPMKIVISEERT